MANHQLARELIQGEVFDLALYWKLLKIAPTAEERKLLLALIHLEEKHIAFWEHFFQMKQKPLGIGRKLELLLLVSLCRLGKSVISLVLEATEIYGVRKYLQVWEEYKDSRLRRAVKSILRDEFKHEERIVRTLVIRRINPEKIRNIFLGLNDGLVEILGAVSGFFAAFGDAFSVLVAGMTVAVAGSISMAAGVYVSTNSEKEVAKLESGKQKFLRLREKPYFDHESSFSSGMIVGISYFIGSLVPILPVLLGAQTLLIPALAAGGILIAVSWLLAYLSGMNVQKRIILNILILIVAVGVTYGIGLLARKIFGVVV